MDKPTCATCPYWCKHFDDQGSCRRHAPRGPYRNATDILFPATVDVSWCGEHPDFPAWIESQRPPKEKPVVIVGFPEDLEAARKLLAQHGFNVPPQDCTAPPE